MQIFQFHIGNPKKYIKRSSETGADDCVLQLLKIHLPSQSHRMNKMIQSLLLHLSYGATRVPCTVITMEENLLQLFIKVGAVWVTDYCIYYITLLQWEKMWSCHLSILFLSPANTRKCDGCNIVNWNTQTSHSPRTSTLRPRISILWFENSFIHFFVALRHSLCRHP